MNGGLSQRLVKGAAWLSVARVFVNALSILSTVALARWLQPSDFGLIALATTLLVVMTELTELSLSQALIRHAAPTRAHFDTAWTLNALRGLVLGAALAASSFPMARIYDDARLLPVMVALGCGVFVGGLSNPRQIMLTRDLIFRQEFLLNVGQKFAGVVASLVVAYVFRSYWALVVGLLVTQVTRLGISYWVYPYLPRIRFAHARELFSFSMWLTAMQFVSTLNMRVDGLFIGKFLGNTVLGHYSLGGTLAAIPTQETTAPLRQTFFPVFSKMQNDPVRLAAAYQRAQAVVTAIALPAGVTAALVADPLIRLTMGEKWVPAIFIVQALAIVFAIQTLGSSADALGMAKGQTRLLFMRSLQLLMFRLPILITGMVYFGLVGLVAARMLTGVLAAFVNMMLVRRLIGVSVAAQIGANARALCCAAAMGLVVAALLTIYPSSSVAFWPLLLKSIATGVGAISLYAAVTIMLWQMLGRPIGPESEILGLLKKAWSTLRAR